MMAPTSTPPTPASGPGTSGRRARQRQDTRERLFEAALAEFRRVGVAAAQIDRIAKAVGVVRGTFYFHFPTKDDVLLELQQRNDERIIERTRALRDAPLPLAEALGRVNEIILDVHAEVGEAGLLRDLLSLYVRRPGDLGAAHDNRPTLTDEIAGHFERAQARGELRTDLEAEQMAVLCLTSLLGFYTRVESREELQRACTALIDVLVKGLRA